MLLTTSREGIVISIHEDISVGKMYSILLKNEIVVVDESEIIQQKGVSQNEY